MRVRRRVFADYLDTGWQAGLFRTLIIGLLGASLGVGPVALITAFGGPAFGFLLRLAFVAAVTAVITSDTLARPDRRGRDGMAVRLGEFILWTLCVRVAVWAFLTGVPALHDVRRWLTAPEAFFDGPFLGGVVVVGVSWLAAVLAAADFLALRIQPDEVAARESVEWGDAAGQWRVFRPIDRRDVLGRFGARWLAWGMVLVLCAAAVRVGMVQDEGKLLRFVLRDAGLPPLVVGGVIVYFCAGLLLMSHGRLAMLRGRWYNEGVRVSARFERRWHGLTVVALAGTAVLALLLPLGATGWLADVLAWLLALLWRGLLWLMALFQAFLALLLLLFQGAQPAEQGNPLPPAALPQAVPSQREALLHLPAWLGGAVLWTLLILLGGYLLMRYVASGALDATWFGRVRARWRLWWEVRRPRVVETLQARGRRLLERRRRASRPTSRRIDRPMPDVARERVRAYYLRAAEAAGERGVAREPHETPAEYARDLQTEWPDAEQDVVALTEAFVAARYSPEEIAPAQAHAAWVLWRRVRWAFDRTRPRTRRERPPRAGS